MHSNKRRSRVYIGEEKCIQYRKNMHSRGVILCAIFSCMGDLGYLDFQALRSRGLSDKGIEEKILFFMLVTRKMSS